MISLYLENNQAHAYFLNESDETIHPSEIFPNLIYTGYSAFDNCEKIENYNDEQGDKRYTSSD